MTVVRDFYQCIDCDEKFKRGYMLGHIGRADPKEFCGKCFHFRAEQLFEQFFVLHVTVSFALCSICARFKPKIFLRKTSTDGRWLGHACFCSSCYDWYFGSNLAETA